VVKGASRIEADRQGEPCWAAALRQPSKELITTLREVLRQIVSQAVRHLTRELARADEFRRGGRVALEGGWPLQCGGPAAL
jgi:hypothetical protein